MAKLVAGVTSVKSTSYIAVPVNVTTYRVSSGRTYDTPEKANAAQARINNKKVAAKLSRLFKSAGVTTPSADSMFSVRRLADKLTADPTFAAKLSKLAG